MRHPVTSACSPKVDIHHNLEGDRPSSVRVNQPRCPVRGGWTYTLSRFKIEVMIYKHGWVRRTVVCVGTMGTTHTRTWYDRT